VSLQVFDVSFQTFVFDVNFFDLLKNLINESIMIFNTGCLILRNNKFVHATVFSYMFL